MSNQLRYDGQVAVITGAGNGLGKVYALFFASRGAKVVVNDLGGSMSGSCRSLLYHFANYVTGDGASNRAADLVVEEIKKAGGEAVADYNSVSDNGAGIIKTAVEKFGRVDILINNAGILRDTSFVKMTEKDWDAVYSVHVKGTFLVTKAAWDVMRKQSYGRIINVTSTAGLYGNFGQANYSMAKLGLLGLAKTLALEGEGKGILVNTIAPLAASRLTETALPAEILNFLKPEAVIPLVGYLCHSSCSENGQVYEVGAGWFAKLRWQRSEGLLLDPKKGLTPEDVRDQWNKVEDWNRVSYPVSASDSFAEIMKAKL
ncbi:hydroxysteroid (17-beta) dehydrogenase 4 [Planoprotostelium fungivorum]|uniref:Hydroxysteroid (17-beta) dehydrogenase 4 n=1 Tax=Planoprotostelium fungivorum TaxID=1890364 RepID=A0A2P6NM51_9EUKA|nr:hydroxysteroid (17-beta) dehydrogenase 4 [Planoprotostelium fungivorum]